MHQGVTRVQPWLKGRFLNPPSTRNLEAVNVGAKAAFIRVELDCPFPAPWICDVAEEILDEHRFIEMSGKVIRQEWFHGAEYALPAGKARDYDLNAALTATGYERRKTRFGETSWHERAAKLGKLPVFGSYLFSVVER